MNDARLARLSSLVASGCRAQRRAICSAAMAAVNPDLHTFTATLHAHVVAARRFRFSAADLVGTYYHKEPDKDKVVFTSGVPLIAQQFDKLYAHIEPPSRVARRSTTITVVSDDGTTTTFKLVPRKQRQRRTASTRVADDRERTVTSMRWNYDNGGYAEMTNHYGASSGNALVDVADGSRGGTGLHRGHHVDDRRLQDQSLRCPIASFSNADSTRSYADRRLQPADHVSARLGHRQVQSALRLLHAGRRPAVAAARRDPELRRDRRDRARRRLGRRSQRSGSPAASRSSAATCSRLVAAMPRSPASTTSRSRPTGCCSKSSSTELAVGRACAASTSRSIRCATIVSRRSRGGPVSTRSCAAIDAAIAAGLTPVKLNCVVMRGAERRRARRFRRADARPADLRALHRGDAGAREPRAAARHVRFVGRDLGAHRRDRRAAPGAGPAGQRPGALLRVSRRGAARSA